MGKQSHHPPHLFKDNTWYMLSASTYEKKKILSTPPRKEYFFELINVMANKHKLQLFAWVILDNHYHMLVKPNKADLLKTFFQQLHGRSAFDFNNEDQCRGRKVWHNYWDTCIRSEVDFWTRFNYIHYNPVKHGYVSKGQDWEFSSHLNWVNRKGEDWVAEILRNYPIIDCSDPSD